MNPKYKYSIKINTENIETFNALENLLNKNENANDILKDCQFQKGIMTSMYHLKNEKVSIILIINKTNNIINIAPKTYLELEAIIQDSKIIINNDYQNEIKKAEELTKYLKNELIKKLINDPKRINEIDAFQESWRPLIIYPEDLIAF